MSSVTPVARVYRMGSRRRASQARLAEAVNTLIADPEKAERYGRAGRRRCIEEFSWARVAEQTLDIYRKVCA